jgi:hypothetical protein
MSGDDDFEYYDYAVRARELTETFTEAPDEALKEAAGDLIGSPDILSRFGNEVEKRWTGRRDQQRKNSLSRAYLPNV